jgi:hypothetical protein
MLMAYFISQVEKLCADNVLDPVGFIRPCPLIETTHRIPRVKYKRIESIGCL